MRVAVHHAELGERRADSGRPALAAACRSATARRPPRRAAPGVRARHQRACRRRPRKRTRAKRPCGLGATRVPAQAARG